MKLSLDEIKRVLPIAKRRLATKLVCWVQRILSDESGSSYQFGAGKCRIWEVDEVESQVSDVESCLNKRTITIRTVNWILK